MKPVNHPLLSCLALSAGFGVDHAGAGGGGNGSSGGGGVGGGGGGSGGDGGGGDSRQTSLSFVVMLRSSLPLDLPIEGIQASFFCV